MASKNGCSSFNSGKRAKAAYLRKHGIKPNNPDVDALAYHHHQDFVQAALPCAPQLTIAGQQRQEQQQLGVARVSEQLFDKVTLYHAQIGSGVDRATLQALADGMLHAAEKLIATRRWDDALNLFTHALAISEKTGDATSQASIVHNIGFCLHSLGEFEAAKAYYEQALEAVRKIPPSLYGSMMGLMYGGTTDINVSRVLHIKERLFDVSCGRLPAGGDYLDEHGRKQKLAVAEAAPPASPPAWATGGVSEEEPSPPRAGQPGWLVTAEEAGAYDDVDERDDDQVRGDGQRVYGSNVGADEHGTYEDEDEVDERDEESKEAARKEWLQYYLATKDWEQASELILTDEEREDLEYLMGREQRELDGEH